MNFKSHLRLSALMLGLSLCGGLLTSPAEAAPKDGTAKPAKAGRADGKRGEGRGGMRGGGMRMMQELDLTDAQKEKLKPIMMGMMKQMKELRQDDTLDRAAKMKQMKEMRADMEKKVGAILTADQKKKLAAMQEKAKAERKANGGAGRGEGRRGEGRRAGGKRGGPEAPAPAL